MPVKLSLLELLGLFDSIDVVFCALDAVPGEHDLDPTMPAEAASSPVLTLAEVSRRTGYAPEIVRRAASAPYHEADLPRLYWRSRRIGH